MEKVNVSNQTSTPSKTISREGVILVYEATKAKNTTRCLNKYSGPNYKHVTANSNKKDTTYAKTTPVGGKASSHGQPWWAYNARRERRKVPFSPPLSTNDILYSYESKTISREYQLP